LKRAALLCAALLAPLAAAAQTVSLAGQMGQRALLVIDGQPQTLAVGETARGVKLLRIDADGVVVERGGVQWPLKAGGAPAQLAGTPAAAGAAGTIVIPVGPGGHFVTQGAINGRPVQFMVDTGATLVAIGQGEAERLGIAWRDGERALIGTANGNVVAYRVTLSSLRVGAVEVANVGAVVVPAPMPMVLLGNSFLTRFQMRRENDVMRLEAR
jgi:aspartyl protease family protein